MVKGLSRFSLTTVLFALLFASSVRGQTLPSLQITNANGTATISWPTSDFSGLNMVLQTATNLFSPNAWSDMPTPTNVISGRTSTNLLITGAQQFFRLKLPLFSFGLGTPIFQFAIFYNLNMEIDHGGVTEIGGPVFCNQSIWAASATLTFSNSVSAVGQVYSNNVSDPFMTQGSETGSGNPTFIIPPMADVAPLSFLAFGTNNSSSNFEAILRPPPNGVDPNSVAGQVYFYNDVDLIISNSIIGANIMVFFQDTNNAIRLTPIPYNLTTISLLTVTNGYVTNYTTNISIMPRRGITNYTTNITSTVAPDTTTTYSTNYTAYSFVSSTNFYDYRESKMVNAIYLDVAKLGIWLTNTVLGGGSTFNNECMFDTGHGINSVYIYNSVPMTFSALPGIRLDNGAQLPPGGLTIVTPQPLYVKGNFNTQINNLHSDAGLNDTSYTYPAALYADAVTILSSNWNDNNTNGTLIIDRNAVSTTINAAVYEGIVPSSGSNYSGGVENFLRLQENWSGFTLTYNGSITVMFPSQYATNFWQSTGIYYNVPTRKWAFDLNFKNQTKLPPLTPFVINAVDP